MEIRTEQPADHDAISRLTTAVFERLSYSDGSEASIIERLRQDDDLALSLVAVEGNKIIGHIAFSPVVVGKVDENWFGLGPVCVAVKKQRGGIGTQMINAGLDWLKSHNASGCVLVGDPTYYSRFGFLSDGKVTYDEFPAELVQWLSFDGTLPEGEVKYRPAFGG